MQKKEDIEKYIKKTVEILISPNNNGFIPKINPQKTFTQIGLDSLQMATFEFKIKNFYKCIQHIKPGFSFIHNTPQKLVQLIVDNYEETANLLERKYDQNLECLFKDYKNLSKIPMSRAQQRIWFLCCRDSESNQNFLINFDIKFLESPDQIFKLRRALQSSIMANPILRTSFSNYGTVQIVHSGTECYFSIELILSEVNCEELLTINVCQVNEIPLRFCLSKNLTFYATFHQILMDGSSIRLFMRNIFERFNHYEQFRTNNKLHETKTYAEYAFMEQNLWNNSEWKSQSLGGATTNFWLEKLKGWETRPIIPIEKHSEIQSDKCKGIMNLLIDAEIAKKLQEITQKWEATFFSGCVSILRILMYKMFGIKDLWIGIPVEKRDLEGHRFDETIGLFLNLCITRLELNPVLTFEEFLCQNGANIKEMLCHSEIPFDYLYSSLIKNSNYSEKELSTDFLQILAIQDFSMDEDEFRTADIKIESSSFFHRQKTTESLEFIPGLGTEYEIMWHFVENKKTGNLLLNIEFDAVKVEAEKVQTLARKFLTLTKNLTDFKNFHPENHQKIQDLHLRTKSDLANFKEQIQNNFTEIPTHSIISAIINQLKRLPGEKIVIQEGLSEARLNASQLLFLTKRYARALEEQIFRIAGHTNVPNDEPVVLIMKRSIDLVISILGLWINGRSVLPISNDWPTFKINALIGTSLSTKAILLTDRNSLEFNWPERSIIHIQTLKNSISSSLLNENYNRTSLNDILYCTFTSGSTGIPKIVVTEGHGLMNLIFNYTQLFHISTNSRIYQVVNYAFDIFFADLLSALLNGAQLILASEQIPTLTELQLVTHAYIMPSYLTKLQTGEELKMLSKLEFIQYGGEAISKAWLQKALQAGVRLVQLFGFTEHSVYSAFQFMGLKSLDLDSNLECRMNIGKAFKNLYLYPVDADGQLLTTIGARGELRSGGLGVARGYLLSPSEKISRRLNNFCYDPWIMYWTDKTSRYFQTGDFVKIQSNCEMKFLGRLDDQVKVNGNRVELQETKYQIEKFGLVQQAELILKNFTDKKNLLVAFITLVSSHNQKNDEDSIALILESLQMHLSPHMIPDKLIILNEFSLTSNGKVDFKDLTERVGEKEINQETQLRPDIKTWTLEQINSCKIFAKFLEIDDLNPDDNLFTKGADSLKILLALQQLNDEFGLQVDLNNVFKLKTIEKILSASKNSNNASKIKTKSPKTRRHYQIPLSYNQQHLWFLDKFMLKHQSDAYTIPFKLEFNILPKMNRLSYTINSLILSNAILRTNICYNENLHKNPYQIVLSGTECYLFTHQQSKYLEDLGGFKLDIEIPIKCMSNDQQLFIVFHHSAVDGESLKNLIKEIASIYSSPNVQPISLAKKDFTKTFGYLEYAELQRRNSYEQELNYWESELESVKNFHLPINPVDLENLIHPDMGYYKHEIKAFKEDLIKFSDKYSCPLAYPFIGAYLIQQLKRYSLRDLVVGIPFANRDYKTMNQIGYFVNTHAIRFSLDSVILSSVKNLMLYITEILCNANKNSKVPFELVVQRLKPARKLNITPLFQQMFNFEDVSENAKQKILNLGSGLVASIHEPKRHNVKFEQDWRLKVAESSCTIEIEYDKGWFRDSEIIQIVDSYDFILKKLLADQIDLESKNLLGSVQEKKEEKMDLLTEIKSIWKEVLLIEQVDANDNFFEIGGHSLLAARICGLIESRLNLKCDISLLFQHQTIKEMKEVLIKGQNTPLCSDSSLEKNTEIPYYLNQHESEIVPVCSIQRQILKIYQNEDINSTNLALAYTIQLNIKLDSSIRLNHLKQCLIQLLYEQPALRTVFNINSDGEFLQQTITIKNTKILEKIFIGWNENDFKDNIAKFDPFIYPPINFHLNNQKILKISLSHLIFDGHSMNIFIQRLFHLYYNNKSNSYYQLADKSTYFRFSNKFNKKCRINQKIIEAYWISKLKKLSANMPNSLEPDKTMATINNTSTVYEVIHPNMNVDVGTICKKFGITPCTLFLYSLGRILRHRVKDFDSTFCIGLVKDMRDISQDFMDTVGFFANTLAIPITTELTGLQMGKSLKEFNESVNEILNHYSFIAYDRILEIIKHNALFDVMLVLDSASKRSIENLSVQEFEILNEETKTTKFQMTFFVSFDEKDISIRVEYLSQLFHRSSIQVIVDEWIRIIRRLIVIDQNVKQLFQEPEVFKRIQISEIPENVDITKIIWEQAQKTPNSIAIQTTNKTKEITYKKLIQIVHKLSIEIQKDYFKAVGEPIKPDTLICLLGHRDSVDVVLLLLAILKAGAAYLPIDEENIPSERIICIVKDSNAQFCISSKPLMIQKTTIQTTKKYVDIINLERQNPKTEISKWNQQSMNKPTDLAYVIFTSGSTGPPKGASLQRLGLINMIVGATSKFRARPDGCIYQFTNFCFDNSVLEIFLALCNGMRLFIDDKVMNLSGARQYFSIQRFCDQVSNFKITHAFLFSGLVDSFMNEQLKTGLAGLDYWIPAAEKLSKKLLHKASAYNVKIIQNYGPTECCCYVLGKDLSADSNPQNLGSPLINTRVTVRTKSGEVAIPMTSHKLYVSGPGIMRGYLRRNADAQPFVYFDGRKYYDTGDIVQRLPNGDIIFVGRADGQVKIRGFRVEMTEIETVLREIPHIKSVKVILDEASQDLIAYLVPFGTEFDQENWKAQNIREFCRQKLPHYMIPRQFTYLEDLPLTANSKLDLQKLASSRALGKTEASAKPIIPQSQNEKKIIEIISEVLNLQCLNLEDNFIYLDGNSLNAQRILNQISQTFSTNINLNIGDLLNSNLRISNFIEKVLEQLSHPQNLLQIHEKPVFNVDAIPLSLQQQQMLYLSHIDPNGYYNLPFIQKFNATINISYLHQSFMELIQSSPILRTRIREDAKSLDLYQEVLSMTESYYFIPKKLEIPELKSRFETCFELQKMIATKFDFYERPAIECRLFWIPETGEYLLILVIHHILSDGKSTEIMENEIVKLYNQIKLGKKIQQNISNEASYVQWSLEQKRQIEAAYYEPMLLKLKDKLGQCLANKISLEQLFRHYDKQESVPPEHLKYFDLPIDQIRATGFTAYTFFSAILLRTISRVWQFEQMDLSNMAKSHFLIGCPHNNRPAWAETTIGNFLNNLILAFPLDGLPGTMLELLEVVQAEITASMDYAQIPYSKIIDALREFHNDKILYEVSLNCRYELENDSTLEDFPESANDPDFARDLLEEALPDRKSNFMEIDVDQYKKFFRVRFRISERFANFIGEFKRTCYESLKIMGYNIPKLVCKAIKDVISASLPEKIHFQDNFFFLGGNSLLLLKLHRKLTMDFGLELDLLEFINNPTVGQISTHIEDQLIRSLKNLNPEILNNKLREIEENVETFSLIDLKIQQNLDIPKDKPDIPTSIKTENCLEVIYENPPTLLPDIIIVLFHSLIGGNLCYNQLIPALRNKHNSLLILGIQHPETFRKNDRKLDDLHTFGNLIDYYTQSLRDFFKEKRVRFDDHKIVFVGASLGALLAYECGVRLRDLRPKIHTIISIDGNASDQNNYEITEAEHRHQMSTMINTITSGGLDPRMHEQMLQNSWMLLQLRLKHKFSIIDSGTFPKLILMKIDDPKIEVVDYGWNRLGFENNYEIVEIPGKHIDMLDSDNCNYLADVILSKIT